MAYAGIQTLLLTYKMQKADKEFELGQVTNKYTRITRESKEVNNEIEAAKAALDTSDEDYVSQARAIDEQYSDALAEFANMEDELQQKQSNLNTEIKQLDGYIESWQGALSTNIQKTHSYGPSASG